MTRRLARTFLLTALAAAALGVAGCGDKEHIVREAETEGIYLDVGDLDYQVQISRQLNPDVVPDASYLQGVPEFVSEPTEEETWFAVFLRVANATDEPHESAEEIHIVDTQGREYRPIDIDPEANAFVYQPGIVEPGELLPRQDSSPALNSAQGALLVFKLTYESLGNRPLELVVEGDEGVEATVNLDI